MVKQTALVALLVASASAFAPSTSRFGVVRQTALFAEKEMDYEAELVKIEKEADDRMDAKVAELMSKIATTGSN